MTLLFALTTAAFAQDDRDLEYRETEVDGTGTTQVNAGFESQWFEYDNLDLRSLDESSDQAIFDSDDRNSFAFTGAYMNLAHTLEQEQGVTRLVIGASHRGLWGNDQLGQINRFGGFVYFTSMYGEFTTPNEKLQVRVGRQYYELGGLGGARDYVLADVLDMVRVDYTASDVVRLELTPITVVGMSSSNDNANFVSFVGQSTSQTYGFRGDHMTKRTGGALVLTPKTNIDVRAYGFYTDVGALGTGSDISENGLLGNFADNDYVINAGLRGHMVLNDSITPYFSLDMSNGIDRKELVARDVDTNGTAVTLGVRAELGDDETGFRGEASFFQASGAKYGNASGDSGLQYSHGYVGMKARQAGGTFADRLMGWHPSAYVGMFGISDSPHAISRKSGTRVLHANAGYDLGNLTVMARWWTFQDMGITYTDLDNLDSVETPFGYSREEFAAQSRMGELLGHEADLDLYYSLTDNVQLRANGAVFLPGAFYEVPISRIAGDQLGWDGEATPWSVSVGTSVRF